MRMYYINSAGTRINFDSGALRITEHDLRNYTWNYTPVANANGNGGRISRFSAPISEKTITVLSRGRTKQDCIDALEALTAATEVDIAALMPGKFYINDEYMSCYLAIGSEVLYWRDGFFYAKKALSMLAVSPFWCTEQIHTFNAGGIAASEFGKRYDGRYAYQYGTGYANISFINDHYTDSPAIITIYGACVDPSIYIADNHYGVTASIAANEYIIIDQIQRKVYKVGTHGNNVNLFDQRDKESDIFKYIPAGLVSALYTGDFGFEIKLIQRRREPKWT